MPASIDQPALANTRKYVICLIAGGVLTLAFAPFNYFFAAIISPAVLFYCWSRSAARGCFSGFLCPCSELSIAAQAFALEQLPCAHPSGRRGRRSCSCVLAMFADTTAIGNGCPAEAVEISAAAALI